MRKQLALIKCIIPKHYLLAAALMTAASPAMAGPCTGWRALYSADIARLNAIASIDGPMRGGDGARPHEGLFDKATNQMNDDGASAEAEGCVWGD
jgi:hypothetical protein